MTQSTNPTGNDSLDPIRRVKAAEDAAKARAQEFAARAKAELDALHHEAESLLAQVRAEEERAHERVLVVARLEAEEEAKKLVAAGKERATQIAGKGSDDLAKLREEILRTVLGEFRPKGK
jgi:vacuolar-type H+-ATPase subunit H